MHPLLMMQDWRFIRERLRGNQALLFALSFSAVLAGLTGTTLALLHHLSLVTFTSPGKSRPPLQRPRLRLQDRRPVRHPERGWEWAGSPPKRTGWMCQGMSHDDGRFKREIAIAEGALERLTSEHHTSRAPPHSFQVLQLPPTVQHTG